MSAPTWSIPVLMWSDPKPLGAWGFAVDTKNEVSRVPVPARLTCFQGGRRHEPVSR